MHIWLTIKKFWKEQEYKIILFFGFILVFGVSFQAGIIKGQQIKENPLIIEKPIETATIDQKLSEGQKLPAEEKNVTPGATTAETKDCAFVGSKNSNKYHLPTCRWAKNIKPENLVCFSDENNAKSKGYLPDKNCIK